jgi:hypothetical protein
VYAAEAEFSSHISKDSEKRVVPRIYTVVIAHLRKLGFEDDKGIKVGGRTVNNLRYANGTAILAEDKKDLKRLLKS